MPRPKVRVSLSTVLVFALYKNVCRQDVGSPEELILAWTFLPLRKWFVNSFLSTLPISSNTQFAHTMRKNKKVIIIPFFEKLSLCASWPIQQSLVCVKVMCRKDYPPPLPFSCWRLKTDIQQVFPQLMKSSTASLKKEGFYGLVFYALDLQKSYSNNYLVTTTMF